MMPPQMSLFGTITILLSNVKICVEKSDTDRGTEEEEELVLSVTLVEHTVEEGRPMIGFYASTYNWGFESPVDIEIVDVTDAASFDRIPPCADPRFDRVGDRRAVDRGQQNAVDHLIDGLARCRHVAGDERPAGRHSAQQRRRIRGPAAALEDDVGGLDDLHLSAR